VPWIITLDAANNKSKVIGIASLTSRGLMYEGYLIKIIINEVDAQIIKQNIFAYPQL